jgi:hypothetical protein
METPNAGRCNHGRPTFVVEICANSISAFSRKIAAGAT